MASRSEVIAAARQWRGTPWQHQGRDQNGLDCAGLLIRVARDLGLTQFDVSGYKMQPDGESLGRMCREQMRQIPLRDMAAGDVVVLKFDGMPHESHLALLVEHPHRGLGLLHACNGRNGKGRVIEHGLDARWRARITSAYRLPGVD